MGRLICYVARPAVLSPPPLFIVDIAIFEIRIVN